MCPEGGMTVLRDVTSPLACIFVVMGLLAGPWLCYLYYGVAYAFVYPCLAPIEIRKSNRESVATPACTLYLLVGAEFGAFGAWSDGTRTSALTFPPLTPLTPLAPARFPHAVHALGIQQPKR